MGSVQPHIFREYDIRGLVGDDLNDESVALIAKGFARMLRNAGGSKVVLGRDSRLSSTRFRSVIAEALNGCGVDVVDIGVVPTPLSYYAAHTLDVDGLVMITGSHNPPEYNGLKIGVGKSTLHGSQIQDLRRLVEAGDFPTGSGKTTQVDVLADYTMRVLGGLNMGPRKLKVVVDAGNGVGGFVGAPLYRAMGMEVDGLFLEPDGNFPNHHPDPTVEANLADLRKRVLETGADLGIAFDGDADRVGVVDEKGGILWGDQLMILYSREVLKSEPGAAIIGEVKCSQTMYDEIERLGGKPVMWKAGHSLIKAKMKETRAALAGEMSGHIFFQNRWFGFDDGVYAGARLLEILSHETRPLSELLADVPKTFASPEIRRDAGTEERKFALVRAATEHFRGAGNKVIDVDGVRVVFDDGFGLVRASNTQPILVLRFEAKTRERLEEIEGLFENTLARLEQELA
ncbi:phosphomannomutase/phosphoglucomutase [Vulgatibacter incomptus]|uniref:Phosphomannomutase n=1 Tax=Vulgatibacter incomptus TaxID=1391653 RepID=A0A0K1PFQ4_9BACT|nr:phosphomannomutase/phosphoglucomutase [Vulgatibacter incomptus]AKU92337.1 Phosphomannomutase [Vulgatibacter incomptus]